MDSAIVQARHDPDVLAFAFSRKSESARFFERPDNVILGQRNIGVSRLVIKYRELVIYVENRARREIFHLPIRGAEFARAHIIRVVGVCLIQKIFIKPIDSY